MLDQLQVVTSPMERAWVNAWKDRNVPNNLRGEPLAFGNEQSRGVSVLGGSAAYKEMSFISARKLCQWGSTSEPEPPRTPFLFAGKWALAKRPSAKGVDFGEGNGLECPKLVPFCKQSGVQLSTKHGHFGEKTAKMPRNLAEPKPNYPERERDIYIYIHTYIHTYTHTYIYVRIYIYIYVLFGYS